MNHNVECPCCGSGILLVLGEDRLSGGGWEDHWYCEQCGENFSTQEGEPIVEHYDLPAWNDRAWFQVIP
jgi:transposase-like protein